MQREYFRNLITNSCRNTFEYPKGNATWNPWRNFFRNPLENPWRSLWIPWSNYLRNPWRNSFKNLKRNFLMDPLRNFFGNLCENTFRNPWKKYFNPTEIREKCFQDSLKQFKNSWGNIFNNSWRDSFRNSWMSFFGNHWRNFFTNSFRNPPRNTLWIFVWIALGMSQRIPGVKNLWWNFRKYH